MKDLIEALQIFLKYSDKPYPSSCEHDIFRIHVDPNIVSDEDITKLEELGFTIEESNECFYSFKYGSI